MVSNCEVIGACYIYRLCNLICGILDRCAHTILSHSGATASQVAQLCFLCIGLATQNYKGVISVRKPVCVRVCTLRGSNSRMSCPRAITACRD
ncbi:hypothetical protein NQZ68_013125 [Dissostichus eleginoides]|nr:hypothetical protein NQZ68_013125 [Dissostichus eleginoides]